MTRFMNPLMDRRKAATTYLPGSVDDETSFTHESSFVIEATVDVVPNTATIDIFFRIQDDNNNWSFSVSSGGDLQLHDQIATTWTKRKDAVGVVSNGDRIMLVCERDNFSGYVNGVRVWTHTASTFNTETDGVVWIYDQGGEFSDVAVWPL